MCATEEVSLGRIPVDISINQTNGLATGKLINRYLDEIPALRSIILVIKSFLNQRSMNEVFSGGLGSYSIVCMAISFLQACDILYFYLYILINFLDAPENPQR